MYSDIRIIVMADGVIIEDTDGISSFTDQTLTLRSKGGAISISGDELMIVDMKEGTVTVSGKIHSVSLL